jgi:hypothetical protein
MSIDFFKMIQYVREKEKIVMTEEIVPKGRHHHWKMRLFITLIMLILAFIGLVVADIRKDGAWNYWRVMVLVFAFLSIFLSWYLRRKQHVVTPKTIWHEIVQWVGLALAVYVVSVYVSIGFLGRFEAGLVVLILLALTIFINGVYVELTFLAIGILLGLFAIAAALLAEYLYTIMLPVTVVVAGLLIWLVRKKH